MSNIEEDTSFGKMSKKKKKNLINKPKKIEEIFI